MMILQFLSQHLNVGVKNNSSSLIFGSLRLLMAHLTAPNLILLNSTMCCSTLVNINQTQPNKLRPSSFSSSRSWKSLDRVDTFDHRNPSSPIFFFPWWLRPYRYNWLQRTKTFTFKTLNLELVLDTSLSTLMLLSSLKGWVLLGFRMWGVTPNKKPLFSNQNLKRVLR